MDLDEDRLSKVRGSIHLLGANDARGEKEPQILSVIIL